jgi:hypothetical protein
VGYLVGGCKRVRTVVWAAAYPGWSKGETDPKRKFLRAQSLSSHDRGAVGSCLAATSLPIRDQPRRRNVDRNHHSLPAVDQTYCKLPWQCAGTS